MDESGHRSMAARQRGLKLLLRFIAVIDVLVLWILLLVLYHGDVREMFQREVRHYGFRRSLVEVPVISLVRALGIWVLTLHRRRRKQRAVASVYINFASFLFLLGKVLSFSYHEQLQKAILISAITLSSGLLLTSIMHLKSPIRTALNEDEMSESLLGRDKGGSSSEGSEVRLKVDRYISQGPTGTSKVSIGRMFALSKPEKWFLIFGTMALVVAAAAQILSPALLGKLIDIAAEGDGKRSKKEREMDLNRTALLLLLLFFVGSVCTFIRASLFNTSGERVVARLRRLLFNNLLQQEIGFFDESKTGELLNRLASDTMLLQDTVTTNISMFLRWMAQLLGCLGFLFYLSWRLTLIMLLVVPLLSIGAVIYAKLVRKFAKSYQAKLAEASDIAQESFSNIRTVRSFGMEKTEGRKYEEKINDTYQIGKKKALAYGFFSGGIGFLAYTAITIVLWFGARDVVEGKFTAGYLTAFMLYTVNIAFALGGLSSLFGNLMNALGATERVFQLLDRLPRINIQPDQGVLIENFKGRIQFKDVTFSYPSRPDRLALNGMSFTVPPNQTYALVGTSGHGKSTALALIQRFYDVNDGKILLDDVDIKDLNYQWLHFQIASVSQEPVLFATTIRENIAYGSSDRTPTTQEIQDAAKLANAHDFIMQFPDGYETMVGERGVRLSGGQKQRIAIARALLMNPKILLLDEATSALDAESETAVQEAINNLMRDRTVIVVAHRLSTIRHASRILVIIKGMVVDEGDHLSLMKSSQTYKNLVRKQVQQWESEDEDAEGG